MSMNRTTIAMQLNAQRLRVLIEAIDLSGEPSATFTPKDRLSRSWLREALTKKLAELKARA